MNPITCKTICCFLCLVFCTKVFAQSHSNEIGIQTDDDSYLAQGADKYYTAGNFGYFRHALAVKDTTRLKNKVLGFEFGQKLYNPRSGSINFTGVDDPRYIDRPFAAYLYVGATVNLLYKDESNLKLGAQIGMVGPAALGRPIQEFVHRAFGLYQPSGWQYQIDNDFQLNLSAEYNRLLARADWADVSLTSYANLGNGFTGAGIGPMFRLGDFNQLFNSLSTQSTAIKSQSFKPLNQRELFFYYKPQLNVIGYDATIQGSLFNARKPNSMEVTLDPERLIFSNQLGIGYSGRRFVIDAAVLLHTKDVKQMAHADQWGSVTILYRFD